MSDIKEQMHEILTNLNAGTTSVDDSMEELMKTIKSIDMFIIDGSKLSKRDQIRLFKLLSSGEIVVKVKCD